MARLEPQICYLPSEPLHHDDGTVPRSPYVEVFDIPEYSPPPPSGPSGLEECRRIAVYRFFCVESMDKDTGILTSIILNSTRDFEARVRYDEVEKQRCLTMITTLCRFKPHQTPEVEGNLCAAFDRLSVDDFFKDDLPDWVPEDALTASDNLQYYEMKESEVEEYKEWLHFYAKLGFFTTCGSFLKDLRWAQPFELRKIIVQTREHVESKKKALAENAIFYIAFKTRAVGRDYRAIIRRTMDGTPGHMSLEIKCFKM
ncbi:hypothetical protein EUTSA_v10000285mg [Eutrema salsugineum]|uniref:Uncharacterized protein n=1 Tax=Eutrema salsugineum TaxID=72664 RepID=V4LRX3_EUTSA|nr:hypothetical protein EUTSA_v10000285mg [Eutrema salsugineum]